MAALPAAMVALCNWFTAHARGVSGDAIAAIAIAAYVAIAALGVVAYRRASRVAVGLDGVRVAGSSRARFFAYRELDDARVRRGDLELVRGGRAIVRLQLFGEDAARRDALLARVRDAIARAREEQRGGTVDLVASASSAELARAAHGAADYRAPALSREQLWALVEGPAIDAAARRSAARALATSGDDDETRARLRVAADGCADPKVRVALQELAECEIEEETPAAARRPRAR
jgi:hypothetical protein